MSTAVPEPPKPTVLGALKPATRLAPVDTTEPILPIWLRDLAALRAVTARTARVGWWRTTKFVVYLPTLLVLLVMRSPIGLGRVVALASRWVYDQDSATLRHEHATRAETPEAVKVHAMRKANLHARFLVATVVALPFVFVIGAWTYPRTLAVIVGLAVAFWTIKVIPGRHWGEHVAAAGIGGLVMWKLPAYLALIPVPPAWAVWTVATVIVGTLGWIGRNTSKGLGVRDRLDAPAEMVKPDKGMVVDALCRIGIPNMTLQARDRVHAETRLIAPGVATTTHGYVVELELPPGVTVDMVVAKRAELASALHRDIGTVWPGGDPNRHPGYLRLFLSFKPISKTRQTAWPVASGAPIDVFDPIPLFTNEEMKWVPLTLMGTHAAVGGTSGYGKSVFLRQLAVALAFDPRARLIVFDGKRSGDLECVRRLAHGFHEGAEAEDVADQLRTLRELLAERDRRARWLGELPPDERSPKVTSALASKYPAKFAPIILLIDECQEYTEFGIKGAKADMKIRTEFVALLTRLARLGRSAGIAVVFVSQKPDATVLPSSIMGNCGIRIAFKVSEQVHNDQVLGTSARKNGVDATMFTARDRGTAWIRGGDEQDAMVARSWAEMVEVDVAFDLAAKAYALREARGLLTGQAAGEPMDEKDEARLLDDVDEVLAESGDDRMHLGPLLERLALLRDGIYGPMDVVGLGAALRTAIDDTPGCGLEFVSQLKVGGRNTGGVRRAEIVDGEVAVVVPLR